MAQVAVCALYMVAAQAGLKLASLHGSVSPFWPASGIAVALLLMGGRRFWPAIAAGAFIINAVNHTPVAVAMAIAVGNTCEGLAGAWIQSRLRAETAFQPFSDLAGWLAASLAAPLFSCLTGVTSLWLAGSVTRETFGILTFTWWMGDAIGMLVVGPVVCTFQNWRRLSGISPAHILHAVLLLLASAAAFRIVFVETGGTSLLFLLLPLLILATALFGGGGAKWTCLGIVVFAVFIVEEARAPFSSGSINHTHLRLETFLFAVALGAQMLAALRASQTFWLPATVLLAGWSLSGWLFWSLDRERRELDHVRLDNLVDSAEDMIRQRMQTYIDILHTGAGLFAASQSVERQEWKEFTEAIDLINRYPGVHGMGVIVPVRERDLPGFLARIRADGAPDFAIHSVPGARPGPADPAGWQYFVIIYIEPEASNHQAIGLDLASEYNRNIAARFSRDYGEPRITSRITLVQDGRQRPGFLLYVPMYYLHRPHQTVHERREAFRGWIYAPFITETFFRAAMSEIGSSLRLDIYDGVGTDREKLLFSTGGKPAEGHARQNVIQLAGAEFTCGWNPGPGFHSPNEDPLLNATMLAVLPVLLAGLLMSLQSVGRRAAKLAEERTRELHQAEAEAEQARQIAEAASAAKSDFLATMSHEIRTPMNAVIGYTDLLIESPLTPEQQSWAHNIQTSGRGLLALINDILDFSKIEAGKLQLESIPFSPSKCVEEALDIMRFQAEQKKLRLAIAPGNTGPLHVLGDPMRFRQILLNLISNALKFTERGFIEVSLGWNAAEGVLDVSVRDTGIGIPPERQERLFGRFHQAEKSTARRYGGTGLGLAICKSLVELMGGQIGVKSSSGDGTAIRMAIPFIRCAEPYTAAPEAGGEAGPEHPGAERKVLLVDDVAANQKLATIVLRRLGCDVEVAGDGREAVAKAQQGRFDIIFMDCEMPTMDGYEATRELRRKLSRHVPIIALTAGALETDRQKCLEAGMDDYILKPFTRSTFMHTLKQWCPDTGGNA